MDFKARNWYQFLSDRQKKLVDVTEQLVNHFAKQDQYLEDYSFLIFSMSKAYEGFLKKFLYELNLINKKVYEGRRFRIGRALNPDLPKRLRDEYWLYDDVSRLCSPDSAAKLWEGWLKCRNKVFHFFATDNSLLTYNEAVQKVKKLDHAMGAVLECHQRKSRKTNRD